MNVGNSMASASREVKPPFPGKWHASTTLPLHFISEDGRMVAKGTVRIPFLNGQAELDWLRNAKRDIRRGIELGIFHPDTKLKISRKTMHAGFTHPTLWALMPKLVTNENPGVTHQGNFGFIGHRTPDGLAITESLARRVVNEKIALIERELGRPGYDASVDHNWGVDPKTGEIYLHDLHFLYRLETRVDLGGF